MAGWIDSLQQMLSSWGAMSPEQRTDTLQKTESPIQPRRQKPSLGYDPDEPLSFVPNLGYLDPRKPKAPERSIDRGGAASIANAQRQAENTGVLTKELGQYFPAIAMTEGWGPNMGVKMGTTDNALYASQRTKDALAKMNLREGKDFIVVDVRSKKDGKMYPHYIAGQDLEFADVPKLAAVYLGEAAKVRAAKGDVSLAGAIEKYNGKGKATEIIGGKRVPADSKAYVKKVMEAFDLRNHPTNAEFYKHYNSIYKRQD
jgi:hypothetical protein